MRKNVVMIDFESVQPTSVESLNHEYFHLIVFCGANQSKVSFEMASTLQKLGSRAQYVKIAGTGHNALDFHIAYYIGRMVQEDLTAFFHIISKDKGFDPLIQHLKENKLHVARWESIEDIPLVKSGSLKTTAERAEAFIAKLNSQKTNKPRSEKTLCSSIKAHFKLGEDDEEVVKVVKAIVAKQYLTLEAGKVVYAEPAT